MDRLSHIFNAYDAFPRLTTATLPASHNPQKEKRETVVSQDRFNEVHIHQIRDGISHIISLDKSELFYILTAVKSLIKEK